ncbi:hypothetical protein [Sphingomonas sp.]|uniref:hypothetical protein n=1 Tax=Sphingomonas sp. TaxID=28214 RepID=UPI001DFCD7CE|nr:hypothetical protein [Sphingomonas sp.]MBX9795785.1 hypothetical protein [Sphingomonas sp.]
MSQLPLIVHAMGAAVYWRMVDASKARRAPRPAPILLRASKNLPVVVHKRAA